MDPNWTWDQQSNEINGRTQNAHFQTNQSPYANMWQQQQQQQQNYNPYEQAQQQSNNQYQAGYFNPNDPPHSSSFGADTNSYLNPLSGVIPQQLLSEPMLNAAKNYGGQFAQQQTEKISQYLSMYKLKYYFAVDNAYVGKKLGLLLFPFLHKDWTVKYGNENEAIPARFDVNAPDLYIPLMAFVTYVLIAGFVLGTQGRFTPEQLGLLLSNALAWLIFENVFILITKYVMNISQALSVWHTLAFSSYKFVGMILGLLVFLVGGKNAYYCTLSYCALAVTFFLIRSVKTFILDGPGAFHNANNGAKRKLYLLLFISLTQPFIMWWLTRGLTAFGGPIFGLKRQMTNDDDDNVDYEALLAATPPAKQL